MILYLLHNTKKEVGLISRHEYDTADKSLNQVAIVSVQTQLFFKQIAFTSNV